MIKKMLIGVMLLLGGAFAYWTLSPLFITQEVDDALPEILLEPTSITDAEITAKNAAGEEIIIEVVKAVPTDMPEDMKAVPIGDEFALVPEKTPMMEDESPAPTTVTQNIFAIQDTLGHPATGDVRVITSPEQSFVRYENYEGTNGPDLFVYLAKDLDADEFVNLGRAKGNQGNINYEVPADINLSEYKYVMTWCRAFGILFDYAEIN